MYEQYLRSNMPKANLVMTRLCNGRVPSMEFDDASQAIESYVGAARRAVVGATVPGASADPDRPVHVIEAIWMKFGPHAKHDISTGQFLCPHSALHTSSE